MSKRRVIAIGMILQYRHEGVSYLQMEKETGIPHTTLHRHYEAYCAEMEEFRREVDSAEERRLLRIGPKPRKEKFDIEVTLQFGHKSDTQEDDTATDAFADADTTIFRKSRRY